MSHCPQSDSPSCKPCFIHLKPPQWSSLSVMKQGLWHCYTAACESHNLVAFLSQKIYDHTVRATLYCHHLLAYASSPSFLPHVRIIQRPRWESAENRLLSVSHGYPECCCLRQCNQVRVSEGDRKPSICSMCKLNKVMIYGSRLRRAYMLNLLFFFTLSPGSRTGKGAFLLSSSPPQCSDGQPWGRPVCFKMKWAPSIGRNND